MIDEFVLVFGLYCLDEVADEIKTDWEIFVLYYRAMHGDEEAEAELKHYANDGAVKDAVRKALENIKDALGIATDLVEELVDIVDGDDTASDSDKHKYSESEIKEILENIKGDGFKNNPLRQEYENKVADLKEYGEELLANGMDEEQVARTLNQARRDLGVKYKNATISIANVRGINNTIGVHGTYKPPCNVCKPLLDYLGIYDIH